MVELIALVLVANAESIMLVPVVPTIEDPVDPVIPAPIDDSI